MDLISSRTSVIGWVDPVEAPPAGQGQVEMDLPGRLTRERLQPGVECLLE